MKHAEENEEDFLYKIGEEDRTEEKEFQTGRISLETEWQPHPQIRLQNTTIIINSWKLF
jgi:hypothetical protein